MRILIVEPDETSASILELVLRAEGMNSFITGEGDEAIELAKLYDYDCILLETVLPGMNGIEVIRAVRTAKVKSAIIVVSGLGGLHDKVRALNTGADDYLTKPYNNDELIARIRASVRRCCNHAQSQIECGVLVLNLDKRVVSVDGKALRLTGKEYQMLELLMLRKGNTISKEQFMTNTYGGMDEPELKIIDVFVCKLRKKLRAANADYLSTVWGRGYALNEPTTPNVKSPNLAPEIRDMREQTPDWTVPKMQTGDITLPFSRGKAAQ